MKPSRMREHPEIKAIWRAALACTRTELLNRIAETATVHGLVVIAGYRPSADWMPLDSLLAPLSGPICPKVLWFGRPEKIGLDLR